MKEHISVFGLPMFKCENRDCGAIVSFDNDLCNIAASKGERGPARMAFNTRAERTTPLSSDSCVHCGKPIRVGFFPSGNRFGDKFCRECGAKVIEVEE